MLPWASPALGRELPGLLSQCHDGRTAAGVTVSIVSMDDLDDELCRAAHTGDDDLVLDCLRRGARPSSSTSKNGWSALHYACTAPDDGGADIVRCLAKAGADINQRCKNGATPLVPARARPCDAR